MKIRLLFVLICLAGSSFGQSTLPSLSVTADYIRSKLLSLTTGQFMVEQVVSVDFDETTGVLKIFNSPGVIYDLIYIKNLNPSSFAWDIYEPYGSHEDYDRFLRLTIVSNSGSNARERFNTARPPQYLGASSKVYFLFQLSKAADDPNFQVKINKAFKRLIELVGGKKEEKDPFGN